MTTRLDFSTVLERLKSMDPLARDAAGAELVAVGRLGLNTVEALRALQAAAEPWPPRMDGKHTASELVWAAARTPRRVYLPVIEEAFAHYPQPAQVEALRLLLRIGERKATASYMVLVERHAAQLSGLGTDALLGDPRHLDLIFPRLVCLAVHDTLAAEICDAASALCGEASLTPECLCAQAQVVLAAEARLREAMAQLRSRADVPAQGWERQAEYLRLRSERTAVLDLLGWLPGPEAEATLREALNGPDRRVKAFVVAALMRRGAEVAASDLAEVAADLELRSWLQSRLSEVRQSAPLPSDEGR